MTDQTQTVTVQEQGNHLELVAEGSWEAGYKSPDAFAEAMGVSSDEWAITHGKPRAWPTSGWDTENGRPWSVLNHYQSFSMVRRQPIALHPQVQPVAIQSRKKGRRHNPGRVHHGLQTTVFITDPHFGFLRDLRTGELTPFHDRRVLEIALQIVIRLRPDRIVFGGDTLDLPDWSDKFLRSPEFYYTTQPAVIEAAWWLGQFRGAAYSADIAVLEGNHDARLEKALMTHLSQVYELRPADEMHLPPSLSVPRLLALHNLKIDYIGGYPDADLWLSDNCIITHGATVKSGPGATVGAEVKDNHVTMIHGHIHRHERASRTIHERYDQRVIQAVCPGCACHVDGRVPGVSAKQNWQQGVAVIRHDEKGRCIVSVAEIYDGECLFEGELYTAGHDERLDELRDQTAWNF